jgi:hypothetical protein
MMDLMMMTHFLLFRSSHIAFKSHCNDSSDDDSEASSTRIFWVGLCGITFTPGSLTETIEARLNVRCTSVVHYFAFEVASLRE